MSSGMERVVNLSIQIQGFRAAIADIVRDKIKESGDWFELGSLVTRLEDAAFEKGRVFERWENYDGS